jgi:hypothetical protein
MTVKLLSLSIEPMPGGFRLPEQRFGEFLTHVHGANGSGKTAVMCALYWVLGGARQVEAPLWTGCSGVRLTFTAATGETVKLFRGFSERLDATIDVNGFVTAYQDEGSWSAALLPLLGMEARQWSSKSGGTVGVYLSVVLPAFAIDQDKGWILPYSPFSRNQFVEDQAQEVTRLLLGLPQRHEPGRDARRKRLTDELGRLDTGISVRGQALDSLARSLPADHQMLEAMRADRDRLMGELRAFDTVVSSMADVDASLQQRVLDARSARDAAARELAAARQRRDVLRNLVQEGTADLDLIGTNEIAADAFRRFCGNPACQFFAGASQPDSYGKRVLYLRDQFKDVVAAMDAVGGVLSTGDARLAETEARLVRARTEYDAAAKAKASDRVVAAVDAVTRDLAQMTRNIALSEQVAAEREARDSLAIQRGAVHADLVNHDDADVRRRKSVAGAAKRLSEAMNRWLTILRANEVGVLQVDEDLRVTIADKVLTDARGPSGSSRQRLILAYHAALLEVSLELGGSHPPLLLFDAPKQHELDPADFNAYLGELRRVFVNEHVQVVMSSRTEMSVEDADAVWEPSFPGEKHPWYLCRDDKPTDDRPTDDKPTDDKPTDDKPTDDKPTDDKPSDGKSTDDKPADDAGAEGAPDGTKA